MNKIIRKFTLSARCAQASTTKSRCLNWNDWKSGIGAIFFFQGNFIVDIYLNFIRFDLIAALTVYFLIEMIKMYHPIIFFYKTLPTSHLVRKYLSEIFPYRWIAIREFIEWPPCSPDLKPLDFLWDDSKSKVNVNRPDIFKRLKERIRCYSDCK